MLRIFIERDWTIKRKTASKNGPMFWIAGLVPGTFYGFFKGKRYLIHDRDPLFTQAFSEILEAGGVKTIKISPKSPNMTPFAERFVRSIKYECLNKMLIFGESHLRYVINEYMEHYHTERPHQGIDNTIIEPLPQPKEGKIVCQERLGGLLKSYRRAA